MNPSEPIDDLIAKLTDWRGITLAGIRKSFLEADREIIEEWKWMGSPVWSRDGTIAVANAHKEKVKVTFAHGAKVPDPNAGSRPRLALLRHNMTLHSAPSVAIRGVN